MFGRYRNWLIGGAWSLLLGGFFLVAWLRGQGPVEMLVGMLQAMQASPWAIVWLTLIYLVRPLFLLPVTVLTVFAGFLYGPWFGALYSTVGAVGTAWLAYSLARWLTPPPRPGAGGKMAQNLRNNAFEAVLTMRLMSFPGDPINFFSGAMRVPVIPFLLATLIGGLPGMMIGVFAGASITGDFTFSGLSIRWEFVAASAVLLVAGLLTSRWLRRRRSHES